MLSVLCHHWVLCTWSYPFCHWPLNPVKQHTDNNRHGTLDVVSQQLGSIKKGPEGPEDAEHATAAYQWSGPVRRLFSEGSEKAHRIHVVADQQVLGLLIAVEDHLVGFPADTGFLVAAKGGVGRVHVVAVGPYPPGLDALAYAVGDVHISGPDTSPKAELGIVGDGQRFGLVLEGGDTDHRAEDLLLEHTHLVVSLEQGRFDVVTAAQFAFQALGVAAAKELGTLLPGNFNIGQNLVELL